MGSTRLVVCAWIIVAAVVAASTGCANDACKTVDGPGDEVVVWWKPSEIPRGARYRVCVDESCADMIAHPIGVRYGDAGPYRAVAAPARTAHTKARFEVLDAQGRVVSSYTGEGDLSGAGCYKAATFRATPGGALSVAAVGHGG